MKSRKPIICASILLMLLPFSSHGPNTAFGDNSASVESLDKLILQYFLNADTKQRKLLARQIDEAARGSIEQVSNAISRATLWQQQRPIESDIVIASRHGRKKKRIHFRLPTGYDPRNAYPVILTISGNQIDANKMSLKEPVAIINRVIESSGQPWVHARASLDREPTFANSGALCEDMGRILAAIRRRIHTDADRFFLVGKEEAGDAAWLIAVGCPDAFAGVFAIDAYPPIPHAATLYPLLLDRTPSLQVVSAWHGSNSDSGNERSELIVASNNALIELAKDKRLPIVGIDLSSANGSAKLATAVSKIMASRRTEISSTAARFFRYRSQGHLGWVTQDASMGEPWTANQLAILPPPGKDASEYVAKVYTRLLSHIEGRIVAQTVDVSTRKCSRITMAFEENSINWSKPVEMRINGVKRFAGMMKPSIQTLLATAQNNWDFQRLTWATRSFSIRVDGQN